ncbi:MAG: hypothetical protein IKB51_04745 [Clostridia bacterium]|nr:hypothetical protein [Clostridia bacterium]
MKKFSCGCFNLCETALVAAPAFGAGVLVGLFMPTCVVCGACALMLLGTGAVCLLSK